MTERSGIPRRRFVQIGDGLVIVGLTGGFASANGDDDHDEHDENGKEDGEVANVRVAHLSPDAPAVDVVVSGSGDALFEDVEFGESGYAEVPEGDYELGIYPAGERDDAVLDVELETAGDTVYSAFAVGYVAPEDAPADEPFDVVLTVDAEADDCKDDDY